MAQVFATDEEVELVTDLVIDHVIMHYLDPDTNNMKLVSREIQFGGSVGEVVQGILTKLVKLSLDSADTYAEDNGRSETLALCWHILSRPDSFVSQSCQLATKLSDAMKGKGNVKKGDVLVVLARDAVGPMVAILKLEKLREFQVTYEPQPDGTFDIKLELNENVVSSREIPQKCAFIREPSPDRAYHVRLHDNQVRERETAAKFFYEEFLGCRLLTAPAKRTINFCTSAETWRREHAAYLPKQGIVSFARALIQHLKQGEVSFTAFAESALAGSNNQELSAPSLVDQLKGSVYEREMRRGDFVSSSFTPDPDTVARILENISLTLSGGLRLAGPTDTMLPILEMLESDKGDGDLRLLFKLQSTLVERTF